MSTSLYVSSRFRSSNLKNIGSECALNELLFTANPKQEFVISLLTQVPGTSTVEKRMFCFKYSGNQKALEL